MVIRGAESSHNPIPDSPNLARNGCCRPTCWFSGLPDRTGETTASTPPQQSIHCSLEFFTSSLCAAFHLNPVEDIMTIFIPAAIFKGIVLAKIDRLMMIRGSCQA
jgi:hypothetical protein